MKTHPRHAALSVLIAAFSVAARADTIRVFAAVSLKESFEAIAVQYERDNPGDMVELNFAGSQVLMQQIRQGAAADVFASADQAHMEGLKNQGLAGQDDVFARNRLVMVAAKDGKVASLKDAARPGIKVVMADGNVPAGRYTALVLDKMDKGGLYGGDYQERVRANTVSLETSVRAVLMKVATGEADAGFVYATDANRIMGKVRSLEIPFHINQVAAYPIAVLTRSASPAKARKFLDLVLGEKGQTLLKERGFLPAP
jgi:molybdate transport system substrate-binding protein